MLMRDHCTAADSPAGYKIRVSCEQNEHIIDPQILERQKKLNQFRDISFGNLHQLFNQSDERMKFTKTKNRSKVFFRMN